MARVYPRGPRPVPVCVRVYAGTGSLAPRTRVYGYNGLFGFTEHKSHQSGGQCIYVHLRHLRYVCMPSQQVHRDGQ